MDTDQLAALDNKALTKLAIAIAMAIHMKEQSLTSDKSGALVTSTRC
jgi:hypothetical protein